MPTVSRDSHYAAGVCRPSEPEAARPKRAVAAMAKSPEVAVKQPAAYVVETVTNGKVTTATFHVNPQ